MHVNVSKSSKSESSKTMRYGQDSVLRKLFIFSIFPLLFTLQNHSYKFIKDCKSHIVGHCDKFRNNLCSRKSLYCRDPFYIWIPRNMRKKFFLIMNSFLALQKAVSIIFLASILLYTLVLYFFQ